jgi:hypothetical protein
MNARPHRETAPLKDGRITVQIEVNEVELRALNELLDIAFRETKGEIYQTQTYKYEEHLKQRKVVLEGLLQKVQAALLGQEAR